MPQIGMLHFSICDALSGSCPLKSLEEKPRTLKPLRRMHAAAGLQAAAALLAILITQVTSPRQDSFRLV
jgi:hypothetical protein